LRARLQQRFANEAKVRILDGLEELPPLDNAIVFANEFFDAQPVEVVRGAEDSERRESLRINIDRERLVEEFVPANSAELEFLDRYGVHPAAEERCEVTQKAIEYMQQIAGLLRRGFVLIIDYGYTREELLAGRRADTLRAFRRHTISDSPYEAPGEQDITANVNFTALRETGLAHGMESGWILTQSQLLMGIGETNEFADAFEDARLPQEKAKVALQLKHLVTPAGIGEIFQALTMQRGVDPEKAAALDGLRFAKK
jgi:SAM-dependent MidA family methyltransferase